MTSSSRVRLIYFEMSIGCDTCASTRRALEQIVESSPGVTLETLNLVLDKERAAAHGVDRVPAVIVCAPNRDRIRYYGAPLGNELPTLIEAITMTDVGRDDAQRAEQSSAEDADETRNVAGILYADVRLLSSDDLARQSTRGGKPAGLQRRDRRHRVPRPGAPLQVNGVPKTVINDSGEVLGAASEEGLVAAIIRQ